MRTFDYFLLTTVLLVRTTLFAGTCQPTTVLFNAFDRDFNSQRDPRAEDLRVEIDHKRVPILSLSLDTHPRRILLMFDRSGSMEASPQKEGWGITLPTAGFATDLVSATASAALTTFSDKLERESPEFEDRTAVGARVLNLAKTYPRGPTLLFHSIDKALIEFNQLRSGDAIYLVTRAHQPRYQSLCLSCVARRITD